jgi:hypothetical protein
VGAVEFDQLNVPSLVTPVLGPSTTLHEPVAKS